jgi:hypothetical protein
MEFIKEDVLYNWRTKDAAGLYIKDTSKVSDPPQEFDCAVLGHSGIVRPDKISIPTASLEFLGAGLFGPPRERTEHHPGWTGDAYKFGVYECLPRFGRRQVVILRTDGSGFYAYVDVSLEASVMWRHLCKTAGPEMLWNVCSCLVHTHDLARQKGRQEIMNAFAEGRLKKKRGRSGPQVYVQAQIRKITPSQSAISE